MHSGARGSRKEATKHLDGARRLFVPIPGERGLVGVIGVHRMDDAERLNPDRRRVLDLLAAQAGIALDRARFAKQLTRASRPEASLLASVSHDLRTPLSTIRGAIESLQTFGQVRDELEQDPQQPQLIVADPGFGYRLAAPDEAGLS